MERRYKQSGRTLAEMTVVIAAIVLLGSFGLPAIRAFLDSFESGAGARPVISAALASARAIAAKEQRYAGIRFQKAYRPEGPLKAPQYMIFIVHDFGKTGLAPGFRAVEGLEPIKLPDSVGVIDSDLIKQKVSLVPAWEPSGDPELADLTSFSIIFSPSGKLMIHNVRIRNRDGIYMPDNSVPAKVSLDDVFNSEENIINYNVGIFVQDDYPPFLDRESSRRRFVIYDRQEFRRAYQIGQAYSGYLNRLVPIYINPYTGMMIEK